MTPARPLARRNLLFGLGALAVSGCATQTPLQSLARARRSRARPSDVDVLSLRWWGTATVALEMAGQRLLTDPAFDPAGSEYNFGPPLVPQSWFASTKTSDVDIGEVRRPIDAVLVSHDQHADNLDPRGRELLLDADVHRVITTDVAAGRLRQPLERVEGKSLPLGGLDLGDKVAGLAWGESVTWTANATAERPSPRPITVTATPAQHGPAIVPGANEVCGFLLEAPGAPTVWMSGDTVMFDPLADFLRSWSGHVDIAIVHCGGVAFPELPVLGEERFTFDAASALAAMKLLNPRFIVPTHHSGWTHFREPLETLRAVFSTSALGPRCRWPKIGEALDFELWG